VAEAVETGVIGGGDGLGWRGRVIDFCQVRRPLATIIAMGRKDKGREICIVCGQTFHKKLTSKELRCTKCRKADKKAA
jgi:hypothetical protein